MKQSCAITALLVLAAATSAAAAANHPILPTMWTSVVKEDEVGIVLESEHFVLHEKPGIASAKWTNYTDGSCQRLIWADTLYDGARYLFGCDATPCCYESSDDGPIEYQIPNIHPAVFAPVKSGGKAQVKLFDGTTVNADTWTWSFGPASYTAYTTPNSKNATLGDLHQWIVDVEGKPFPNQYVNFTAVPAEQAEAFYRTFTPPTSDECPNKCSDMLSQGKLSDKSFRFLMKK
eukprot:g1722.t1